MRNERQISILSDEELAEVAATLGIARLEPEWIGGNLLKFRVPMLEVFFTLICGASAVAILEALR